MEKIKCPKCGCDMIEVNIAHKTASKYEDCIRRCESCQIGASNAQVNPVIIYKNYRNNICKNKIPESFLENLDETLAKTLNQANRENKKIKLGFSTSEDAVSWIFIKYFSVNNALSVLQNILDLKDEISEILMWGVPQINRNSVYTEKLQHICTGLGEDKKYYTEPDIIVITKSTSVFIEVKVKSANDKQKLGEKDYDKYLSDTFYTDVKAAKESLCYELIRNWTVGNLFAENNFKLINLAPGHLFLCEKKSLTAFTQSLKGSENFIQLSWEAVFDKLNKSGVEEAFRKELEQRIFR
ncbi:MAG: hypothetical protein ACTTIU_09810 [Treponema lecithinolyticum]|uniref:hypothetical protein n=1 Tax=Treponema lecithinolyticum TaxID=53418 RepID=UPI003FA25888